MMQVQLHCHQQNQHHQHHHHHQQQQQQLQQRRQDIPIRRLHNPAKVRYLLDRQSPDTVAAMKPTSPVGRMMLQQGPGGRLAMNSTAHVAAKLDQLLDTEFDPSENEEVDSLLPYPLCHRTPRPPFPASLTATCIPSSPSPLRSCAT